MVKTFVLDTNVLLHNAQSLEAFADNDVAIPMAVLEELDRFKRNQDELGRNARHVIRKLDAMRNLGSLREGVELARIGSTASGKVYILGALDNDFSELLAKMRNAGWSDDLADNRILCSAWKLSQDRRVVFVSKDINLRLKADALGLKVMDFEREKVDSDRLYTGYSSFEVSESVLEGIYRTGVLKRHDFKLNPNEFAILTAPGGSKRTAVMRSEPDGTLRQLPPVAEAKLWNVSARNREQQMALALLADPMIKLVTLVGGAGTGKTLLALAAALQSTLRDKDFERILVSRPIVPLGNDIGYLPGDKADKLSNWMQPIFDNLDFLLPPGTGRPANSSASDIRVEQLVSTKKLELEAITYIRGRSIPNQFVIIDEAQNLTPHEVKTVISRAGEGTKMILTGDPWQIDNPYLDTSSNGLTYCVEQFKHESIAGHVTLKTSERSQLAALAARLL